MDKILFNQCEGISQIVRELYAGVKLVHRSDNVMAELSRKNTRIIEFSFALGV